MKQINNRTKIIATIGPSSSDYDILKEMIKSGVDVVRLNFSHGEHEDHKNTISNVRKISDELGTPITVLQDLQGPNADSLHRCRVNLLCRRCMEFDGSSRYYVQQQRANERGDRQRSNPHHHRGLLVHR